MKLDSAVSALLDLDPRNTTLSPAGGGGCSSATSWKVKSTLKDGKLKSFFMKTGSGAKFKVMFEGEHASLNAIHKVVPSLCPRSYGHGTFEEDPRTHFLITDFIYLSPRGSSTSAEPLSHKLAKLHTTPTPVPEGHEGPKFGFPVSTCCGDTPQDNSWNVSWAEFYATNRLNFILERAERRNGQNKDLRDFVNKTVSVVVPRLIGDGHLNNGLGITPVLVHGDLWSGNASTGIIGDAKISEEVIYDSSACYAHSEYELGIMNMFGGFGGRFLQDYHELCPKTEPAEEYTDRVRLYELYHHLNHYALFGGGYKSGAMAIMRQLTAKYGAEEQ